MFRASVRISGLAACLLVVLRLSIGWHFLYEGLWKRENPSFSAEAFLRQSRGPLARHFHKLIDDFDGRWRLDPEHAAQRFKEKWEDYRREFAEYYVLSEEQKNESQAIYERKTDEVRQYLSNIADDVKQHFQKLDELRARAAADRTAQEVPFQQKRYYDNEKELQAKAAAWLAEIERLETEFQKQLYQLLDSDQKLKGAAPHSRSKIEIVDMLTLYSLLAIGFCLMVGLFTRLACLGGAAFLLQVVLSQPAWPMIYPPLPPSAGHSLIINKEFIEMIALLALAATPVGRWAGIDFFIHYLLVRPFKSTKEVRHASKS